MGKNLPQILIHALVVSKGVMAARSHERSEPLLLEGLHLHHLVKSGGAAARRPHIDGLDAAIVGVHELTTTPILAKPPRVVHARPPEKPIPVPAAPFLEISQERRVVDGATPAVEGVGAVDVLAVREDQGVAPPARADNRARRLIDERQLVTAAAAEVVPAVELHPRRARAAAGPVEAGNGPGPAPLKRRMRAGEIEAIVAGYQDSRRIRAKMGLRPDGVRERRRRRSQRQTGLSLVDVGEEESVGAESKPYHLLLPRVLNQNVTHDFRCVIRIQTLDPRHHYVRSLGSIHEREKRERERGRGEFCLVFVVRREVVEWSK